MEEISLSGEGPGSDNPLYYLDMRTPLKAVNRDDAERRAESETRRDETGRARKKPLSNGSGGGVGGPSEKSEIQAI